MSLLLRARGAGDDKVAALHHSNVALVFQFGTSPDATRCYYAMELIEGETLAARVRRDGPLNAKEALKIAIQIARALVATAAHDLVHRDLEPSNIMLTGNSEVKIVDFGLAKRLPVPERHRSDPWRIRRYIVFRQP
ncbi:MAG: protein kinase [Candidatus Udaeobacter sp.]